MSSFRFFDYQKLSIEEIKVRKHIEIAFFKSKLFSFYFNRGGEAAW